MAVAAQKAANRTECHQTSAVDHLPPGLRPWFDGAGLLSFDEAGWRSGRVAHQMRAGLLLCGPGLMAVAAQKAANRT
jgi:hypothetical protein